MDICPHCYLNVSKLTVGAAITCGLPVGCILRPKAWTPERFMEPPVRDPLLVERQATHGSFELNAMYSQRLKEFFSNPIELKGRCYSPAKMCDVHREALDMIALKLSRILSGQASFKDHWDDIAGYAKLASEACDDTRKSA